MAVVRALHSPALLGFYSVFTQTTRCPPRRGRLGGKERTPTQTRTERCFRYLFGRAANHETRGQPGYLPLTNIGNGLEPSDTRLRSFIKTVLAWPRPQLNRRADVCCGSLFDCNCLPYEPVIGLSGRARLLPSRKYREIKLGGSLALPDKW